VKKQSIMSFSRSKSPHLALSLVLSSMTGLAGCAVEHEGSYAEDPDAGVSTQETPEQVAARSGLAEQAAALTVTAQEDEYPRVGDGFSYTQGLFPFSTTKCLQAPTYWRSGSAGSSAGLEIGVSQQTLATDFSVSASAKASYGLFSGEARASFMRTSRTNNRSITYVNRIRTVLGDELYDNASGGYSFGVSPADPSFYTRCGDYFVNGVKKGGSVYVVINLDFASEADKIAYEASVGGSYAGISGKGSLKAAQEAFAGRINVRVRAYQEGGNVAALGQALAGTTKEEGAWVLPCSLGDFDKCVNVLTLANTYAGTTFGRGLNTSNASFLSYDVRPWSSFPEYKLSSVGVSAEVKAARDWLRGKLNEAADVDNLIYATQKANYFGGDQAYKDRVVRLKTQNTKNVSIIEDVADICFDGNDGGWGTAFCVGRATDSYFADVGFVKVDQKLLEAPLPTYTLAGRSGVVITRSPNAPEGKVWPSSGSWKGWKMCPAGTFATGYAIQVESSQGSGDDSAMNGVLLRCDNWSRSKGSDVTVYKGQFGGEFHSQSRCLRGAINGFAMKVEAGYHEDDTGVNDLKATCTSDENIQAKGGMVYGAWSPQTGYLMCPAGTAVCGAQVRYQNYLGSGLGGNDDTAMQDLEYACCKY